jgi:mannose-6-phosphate isomerase-like protein (cupin superfamily)
MLAAMNPAAVSDDTARTPRPSLGTWQGVPGATSGRYEAGPLGAPVSGFVVDAGDGEGPGLHWHPYAETFVVLAGRGRFQRGDEVLEAATGDVVVVPPDTLHRFVAIGPERLRLVSIHASGSVEQTFVD